jgi:hypothetical protein
VDAARRRRVQVVEKGDAAEAGGQDRFDEAAERGEGQLKLPEAELQCRKG